jgi:integrase
MREIPRRERKIAIGEMRQFWDELPLLYRDIAMMQFYIGGRIGEAAGLQVKNIDLDRRVIAVREVLTWIKGKPVVRATPKNGEVREIYLTDTMLEIVLRRIVGLPKGCAFLFNDEGRPLRYNRINDNYNRAWQRAGLKKFSGTHQMRYGAAQAALQLVGKKEAVGAVTGHKSQQMADKYSLPDNAELNRDSLMRIESHLNKKFGPPPEAGQPRIGTRGASGLARTSRVKTPSACRLPESEGWG